MLDGDEAALGEVEVDGGDGGADEEGDAEVLACQGQLWGEEIGANLFTNKLHV